MVTVDELRHEFGLAAEYYAKLFNMTDVEFRVYVDSKLKEQAQNIREEEKERRYYLIPHKHHTFSGNVARQWETV